MEQAISNKTIVKPATKIVLRRISIELGENPEPYAICDVDFVDSDGRAITRQQVGLTADELKGWGEDDTILIPIIIEKLGVSAK